MLYAAIDLGTYLCRLIIAEKSKKTRSGFKILSYYTGVVNFGKVKRGGVIDDFAIQRVENIFQNIKEKIKNVEKVKCVATAALRLCENAQKITKIIKEKYEIDVEIITPMEEAELAANASYNLINKTSLVIDVGSGSTEFCVASKKNGKIILEDWESLEIGLTNMRILAQKQEQEIEKIKKLSQKWGSLPIIFSRCTPLKTAYMISKNKFSKSINNKIFEMNEAIDVINKLIRLRSDEIEKNKFIGSKRKNLIKNGLSWIAKILDALQGTKIILSDAGIREGLMIRMISEKKES